MSEKRRLEEVQHSAVNSSHDDGTTDLQAFKRARVSEALVPSAKVNDTALITAPPARSSLPSPTLQLTGHQAAVYALRFDRTGRLLASGGADKRILLWEYAEQCNNTLVLTGHMAAVLDIDFTASSTQLVSASVDASASVWDVETGQRVKRLRHHTDIVNTVAAASHDPHLFVTASDDGYLLLHDTRTLKRYAAAYAHSYPIFASAFSTTVSAASGCVYHAGLDSVVYCHDLRAMSQPLYTINCHADSLTGLALSADDALLASHSIDGTIALSNVQPYTPHPTRLLAQYRGTAHDHERNLLRCSLSPDSALLSGGSADRVVNVWECASGEVRWRLPGHKGCVNSVVFHPTEPVIASASNDKRIFVGEL